MYYTMTNANVEIPADFTGFCIFEIDIYTIAAPGTLAHSINSIAMQSTDKRGNVTLPGYTFADCVNYILANIRTDLGAVRLCGHFNTVDGISFGFDCTPAELEAMLE